VKTGGLLVILAASTFLGTQAYAQSCVPEGNCAPPQGAFLDLAVPNSDGSGNTGQVPTTYTQYSAAFVATGTTTNLTFALRSDPGFFSLSNISLTDITTPSGNLVLDGDFSAGTVDSSSPPDWTYLNQYGALSGGQVEAGCGRFGNNCWYDGSTDAYDAITQQIATTIGDVYDVTFWLSSNANTQADLSAIAKPRVFGLDALVFAGQGIPVPAPEPASAALLGSFILCLGVSQWRRKPAGRTVPRCRRGAHPG
jgi:hypothetical protein